MTLLFLGLWLVCGFAAVVFAAISIRGPWSIACAAVGFGLGALSARYEALPDPVSTGALAVLVAGLGIAWPRHWILTSMSAGVMAGFWSGLFRAQGMVDVPALALAGSLPVLSAVLAWRRPNFAPPVLRDEALLAVLALGCVVSVAPGVQEGWRAALNLTVDARDAAQGVPVWTLALSLGAMVLGGAWTLWRRR